MKNNTIKSVLGSLLLYFAFFPMAAQADYIPLVHNGVYVAIDTTINNVNGGTLEYKGLDVTQLVTPSGAYSQYGTPLFHIPAGDYQVIFHPVDGYRETHSSNCTGTAAEGATIHCQVTYTDGVAVSYPVDSTPVVTDNSTATTTDSGAATSTPTTGGTTTAPKSGLTTEQVASILGLLRAFGVDEATVLQIEGYLK